MADEAGAQHGCGQEEEILEHLMLTVSRDLTCGRQYRQPRVRLCLRDRCVQAGRLRHCRVPGREEKERVGPNTLSLHLLDTTAALTEAQLHEEHHGTTDEQEEHVETCAA